VEYKVVKNTLTKLAAKENGLEELEPYFNGPTSMAFSDKDVVAPAKIMVEYAEKYENLELKVGENSQGHCSASAKGRACCEGSRKLEIGHCSQRNCGEEEGKCLIVA